MQMRSVRICGKIASHRGCLTGLDVDRRRFLGRAGGLAGLGPCGPLLAGSLSPMALAAVGQPGPLRVAGGWRLNGREDQVGVLRLDWARGEARIEAAHTLPSLPHGIVPEAGGGFLAVASRPGSWLLRVDAEGGLAQQLHSRDEGDARSFDGHVIASADGQWLYTGETERRSGAGFVSVRDARTLRKVAEHRTQGLDPHQILLDPEGMLLIANGGIPRTASGAKTRLEDMRPALVRIDPRSGELLGQWQLPDPRLSLRHAAWNRPLAGGQRLLGIGLQAEHDDAERRREAPLLALWDGQNLSLPTRDMAEGYAGDVAAGPNGGFVLSAQKANRVLLWQPHQPAQLTPIGKVQDACALWPLPEGAGVAGVAGIAIGGGLGMARWHATEAGQMLRWPAGLAAGNHWAVLG